MRPPRPRPNGVKSRHTRRIRAVRSSKAAMADDGELERLEADLRAVERRLAARAAWARVGPRVRRAVRRPWWDLAWALALFAVCVAVGFRVHHVWLVAAGLLLAVLPDRVRAVRRRRGELAQATEVDLFALHRRELELRRARHVLHALMSAALALLFASVAALAPRSLPGLVVAALLLLDAVVRMLWLMPRAQRELRALGEGEAAA